MRVVCTAGHVDHGKSTLVEALTGTHPDRFAEERRRGLTIDLGFAHCELATDAGPPVTAAFVDLPGHERFVGNMLAGAGAVELALLVVAADEGWMPQTAEHAAILDLLGVRHGLVAVTKTDAVDAETAELAVELARDELAATSLADCEVVAVSAATGEGVEELRERLHAALVAAPDPADRARPRLWVDRSFSVAGAGTVATGTLTGGALAVGDDVAALPDGPQGRIRGLQQLGSDVDRAAPGSRVAVALAGVEREDVPRGRALVRPGQWRAAGVVEARLRTVEGLELTRKGAWKLHAGSAVRDVRVAPLLGDRVAGEGDVRLELDEALPLVPGDRIVLRESGRQATVAGGTVLDADPPPSPRGKAARAARSEALDARAAAVGAGDDGALLARHVAERGVVGRDRALAAVGAPAAAIPDALVGARDALVDPDALGRWGEALRTALGQRHAAEPVERAAPKDVATRALSAAGVPAAFREAVLDALVGQGVAVAEGAGLRLPEHAPTLAGADAEAKEALLTALDEAGFAAPRLREAAEAAGASASLLRELEAAGELVRVGEDLALLPSTLAEAHRRLHAAYAAEGPLTAARAKDVLGTTRRVALPLLEHLDRAGATQRIGDVREVREPGG